MVEWIVKRAQGDRARVGTLAGMVCIVANVALCAAKGAIGVVSGSVSIVADAMNNLSDASSNIVSVLGFKLASKPADPEHPYGHGRYEYLSGLVVAALVLLIGVELVKSSVERVIHPEPVEFSLALVAVLVLSMVVKLWMAALNQKLGDRIESETLHATAQDSKNDVLATGAVLACAIVSQVTHINLDAWVGLAVGAYIGWSGFELIQDTVSPLLGQSPDPKLVKHIRDKIMSYPGVLGVHDLMVHDYGPGHQFASLHVEFPAEADPLDAHDVIDNIERDFLKKDHLQVTIHYDPIVTSDAAVGILRSRLMEKARQMDPRLSIHDLRIVPGDSHTNVLFDLVFPAGYTGDKDARLAEMCNFVKEQDPRYCCMVKVEQSYASALPE